MSSKPPIKRKKPEDRRTKQELSDNCSFNECLDKDKIVSLSDLRDNFSHHVSLPTLWKCASGDSCVLFYILDVCCDVPTVKVSIKVVDDLSVSVCCGGSKIDQS